MAAHIEADCHAITVLLDDGSGPIRILKSGRANVHTGCSCFQGRIERCIVTHTAGHFNIDFAAQFLDDGTQLVTVVARAERGVKIDQVNPFRTGLSPRASGLQRRTVVGFRTGFTLAQANGLAITNIDGGKQCQRHVCTSL